MAQSKGKRKSGYRAPSKAEVVAMRATISALGRSVKRLARKVEDAEGMGATRGTGFKPLGHGDGFKKPPAR